MKSLIHLNILCISLIYVYGQGHIGEFTLFINFMHPLIIRKGYLDVPLIVCPSVRTNIL